MRCSEIESEDQEVDSSGARVLNREADVVIFVAAERRTPTAGQVAQVCGLVLEESIAVEVVVDVVPVPVAVRTPFL